MVKCKSFTIHRSKKKTETKIKDNDGTEMSTDRVPNYFNIYFTNIARELVKNLTIDVDWGYFGNIRSVCSTFVFIPCCPQEIVQVISSMKDKGNLLFDIKPSLLKLISEYIAPILSKLYNQSIDSGTYPKSVKHGRVVPVFKSGDSYNVGNYRPITNLLTFNKIFEVLTHNRISTFLQYHNVISDRQYGFRKGISTTTAIFTLVNDLLISLNKKYFTVAVFLDLKKAFDTVNPDILLYKLNKYGFRGLSNLFFGSYLKNRQQFVHVNNKTSKLLNMETGVPQGSVLGPQLFNIFINDLLDITPGKCIFFADDGVFYISDICFESCIRQLNLLLRNIQEWIDKNKLVINAKKTKLMLFTNRNVPEIPEVFMRGTKLEWVSSFRYLGIILDSNLNFILQSKKVLRRL